MLFMDMPVGSWTIQICIFLLFITQSLPKEIYLTPEIHLKLHFHPLLKIKIAVTCLSTSDNFLLHLHVTLCIIILLTHETGPTHEIYYLAVVKIQFNLSPISASFVRFLLSSCLISYLRCSNVNILYLFLIFPLSLSYLSLCMTDALLKFLVW